MDRYISSNDAFPRIFGFPLSERFPVIVQLALHREYGQHVYYTEANGFQVEHTPIDTYPMIYTHWYYTQIFLQAMPKWSFYPQTFVLASVSLLRLKIPKEMDA